MPEIIAKLRTQNKSPLMVVCRELLFSFGPESPTWTSGPHIIRFSKPGGREIFPARIPNIHPIRCIVHHSWPGHNELATRASKRGQRRSKASFLPISRSCSLQRNRFHDTSTEDGNSS